MSKNNLTVIGIFIFVLLPLLTIGIHTALKNNALGYDYLFYWQAGKALFVDGINPYSLEVIQRIQMSVYGRLALPGEYPFPFPYPLPILFVPLPLYFLSYDWSQAAWMAVNLIALLAVGILLFRHAPKWLVLTFPLFYQISFTWVIGNYALLIGVVFIFVFYTLFYTRRPMGWTDFICGMALAWVTNKPQMVWLYLILALVAALRERRWKIILGFTSGVVIFHTLSLIILPDWPLEWLNVVRLYPQQQVDVPSLVTYLGYIMPTAFAWTTSAILAIPLLAATIWFFQRWWVGELSGILLLAWCGLITSLADLSALTPDQIVLLVPVLLWAAHQPPTNRLKAGWFAAILMTYLLFFMTTMRILPDAVDRGPLLMYIVWMVWIWRPAALAHRILRSSPTSLIS